MATEKETSPEAIIQQILEKKPELGREQLASRLSVARNMTGGLIADASLLRMIAAELGIEIANGNETFSHRLSLGHVVAGLNNATVLGRVVAIYPTKEFEGPKPGKLASVIIADKDGLLRVVLWNDKTNILESGSLKVGQIVKFAHGYTKADKFGTPELHVGEKSQIELAPQNIEQDDYPSISKFSTKIQQLSSDRKGIHLQAKVKEVLGSSAFIRNDQTQGKVLRVRVSDDTGEITTVFWNEKADEIESKVKRNANIEIVNAKTKSGQNGETEIHVDFSTYIDLSSPEKCLIRIANLTEQLGDVCVEGEVATLPVSREVRTQKGEIVKIAVFELKDETGSIKVNAWREHADVAGKLLIGEKLMLNNVYSKKGFNGKLELSTRSASTFSHVLDDVAIEETVMGHTFKNPNKAATRA